MLRDRRHFECKDAIMRHWYGRLRPRDILERESAFVVLLGGTPTHISAQVYIRPTGDPRRLSEDAPDAERKLANAVIRYVTQTSLPDSSFTSIEGLSISPTVQDKEPNAERLRRLATQKLRQRQYGEALDFYRAADRESEPDHDTLFNQANCLDGLGRKDEAQGILERIYRENPDHEEAALSLANHYLDHKRFAEAIALYSRWSNSPRNGPVARYNLGIAYLRQGDLERARAQMVTISANDRLYEPAARNIQGLDRLISDAASRAAAQKRESRSVSESVLKFWPVATAAVPLLLLYVFRRRVRPSLVVDLEKTNTGAETVRVRNTSAAEVAVFDLCITAYATDIDGESQIASVTSDLAPATQCSLQINGEVTSIRVDVAGVYYLFPRVRVGAFRFRRSYSPELRTQ